MKGADMILLWGGCQVPVIDLQLIRYMAPHVMGVDFREYSKEQLILWKDLGKSLDLDPDRPAAERRIVAAKDIQTDDSNPDDNPNALIHISAMEKAEVSRIQSTVGSYNKWREAAYQMAEAEGLDVNRWHVANWLEYRNGSDPDKRVPSRGKAWEVYNELLLGTQEFAARTFGPTIFPDAPAEWPLPAIRYPRRERRKRLAGMRDTGGISRAEMAEREDITLEDVDSDLAFYDRQQAGEEDETPGAFVGFEGPFGFDDDITKESKDWIQYMIGSTPVIVRRTGTKPGLKLNPQYKGAGQPQQLLLEFRLRASTRRDMERINFLLERLREDNPTMTVNVNVKTNGKTARRRLPTWEDRPYRLEPAAFGWGDQTPSAELGVFYTPEHYDPLIQEYRFYEYGPLDEDDSPYIDAYEHQGTDISGEGELLDDEVYHHEDMGKAEFLSGETSKSHAVWDIDDVKVEVDYGPWTSRLGEYIDHAAWVSIERYGGAPFDSYMFTPGGPIAKVTDLLDRIHRSNPNIRIVATATRDEERGDIRAKVYERYGWQRISGTDASGSVDMELPHPDQRSSRSASAFDGIAAYADDIMALV